MRSRYGVARGHGVCSNLDRLLRERSCCTWSGECGKCIESPSIELNTVRCGCIVRRCNVRCYPRARSARSLLRSDLVSSCLTAVLFLLRSAPSFFVHFAFVYVANVTEVCIYCARHLFSLCNKCISRSSMHSRH